MRQNRDNRCKWPPIAYSSTKEIELVLVCQCPEFPNILTTICVAHLSFNLSSHFEKKQLKDQIDEANELSGFKLANHGILKKESEYF